jgi:hypothetical protein
MSNRPALALEASRLRLVMTSLDTSLLPRFDTHDQLASAASALVEMYFPVL